MAQQWNIQHQGEVEDVVETLLQNRGIPTEQTASFLNPDWDLHTHDPAEFLHIKAATNRLFFALEQGEKILIHGDYDADGVSGSTLLFTAICEVAKRLSLTPNLSVYLPDRERDGYGVALHTVERVAKEGVTLMITVDCGIANAVEFDRAHELGLDVIICDHHQLGERLPDHAIIIHPLLPGETYPNKHLCGTGVAFKFATMLIRKARTLGAEFMDGYEKWFLDLVAIATVTDVMPLLGENRVLETYGLLVLNKTRRPGIQEIVHFSRAEMGKIDTQAIGFQIGPRINAAGRITSAEIAFKTLAAKTVEEAKPFAEQLEQLNRERQRISDTAFKEALQLVKADAPIQVVWSETWNPGVVGLIAGKLVTKLGVPAFALTKVDDKFVGSGRSIGGLNLVEAMKSCGDIFIKAGGHPQACGLTIANEELVRAFQSGVEVFANDFFDGKKPEPMLNIDFELPLDRISWDLFYELQRLSPYGEGNRPPVFMARGVQIIVADTVGSTGAHLRLQANQSGGEMWKMIGFGLGSCAPELDVGDRVDIAYELVENVWQGSRQLECRLVDVKKVA